MRRTLDRKVEFDERSRLYRAVEGIEELPLRSRTWKCEVYNDQGQEGACVGFAWSHELAATPRPVLRDSSFALEVYNRARQLDPWPGENYDGTSVLAGAKAVMELKNSRGRPFIGEYRWAFGIEDVLRTIGYRGPVILGIEWHTSHYYPDENGQIWLNNRVAGGHAILAKGFNMVKLDEEGPDTMDNVDVHRSLVRLHNSWGQGYGLNGDCFMSVYDLRYLLSQDGEALIPSKRAFDR